MKRTPAIGYIHRRIADIHEATLEHELRAFALAEHLDLTRLIMDDDRLAGMAQLFDLIRDPGHHRDLVVLLPSMHHIPWTPLDQLCTSAHVETLRPRRRYTKILTQSDIFGQSPPPRTFEVSDETRSVPEVAALRADLVEAYRRVSLVAEPWDWDGLEAAGEPIARTITEMPLTDDEIAEEIAAREAKR